MTTDTSRFALTSLSFQGEKKGLRVYTEDRVFDVANDTLKSWGLTHYRTAGVEKMFISEDDIGLLITERELDPTFEVSDMELFPEVVDDFKAFLVSDETSSLRQGYSNPWEYSQTSFSEDEAWGFSLNAVPTTGWVVRDPNGAEYPAKGLDLALSEAQARKVFHFFLVRERFLQGCYISEAAMISYPELLLSNPEITRLMGLFRETEEGWVCVSPSGEEVSFDASFLSLSNVDKREKVKGAGLASLASPVATNWDVWLDSVELVCIAISRLLRG